MVEIAKNGGNLRKKSNTFLLKFDEQSPAPQIVTYQQMQNNFWFVDVLERCLPLKSAQNILTIFCHRSTALLVSKYGCLFWHARTCTYIRSVNKGNFLKLPMALSPYDFTECCCCTSLGTKDLALKNVYNFSFYHIFRCASIS